MSTATRRSDADGGDRQAPAVLLQQVYDELRKLATARLAAESSGHTLQPTALVHEVYLRLMGSEPVGGWNGRGHFFAAAAEAMRWILVESTRRRGAAKRGGGRARVGLDPAGLAAPERSAELLAIDAALDALAAVDPRAAELVKLRYFVGLPMAEAAEAIGLSTRSAERLWTYARAWLRREIEGPG